MEIKGRGKPKAAALQNVHLLMEAVGALNAAGQHLPRMGVMFGPSGFGKSVAATVAMAAHDAVYVEVRSGWTRKALLETLAGELGVRPAGRDWKTTELVAEELSASQRVVLIDEADTLIRRGLIEVTRDLMEMSQAPIFLIGEEALPAALARHERVHNRVLRWVPAMPATLDDARALAEMYVPGLPVDDHLLGRLIERGAGRVRRIVVNLDLIQEEARKVPPPGGIATLSWWGDRALYTGQAPARKVA